MRRSALRRVTILVAIGAFAQDAAADDLYEWRRLATNSRVVVTATVTHAPALLERPERRAPQLSRRADGRLSAKIPPMSDYVEGSVVEVHLDQIHKGDGALETAADVVLFTQDPYLHLEKGTSYVFFLRAPIVLLSTEGTKSGKLLVGTTYRDSSNQERAFVPAAAYQVVPAPQMSGVRGFVRTDDPIAPTVVEAVVETVDSDHER
jgi:hypothetical protein